MNSQFLKQLLFHLSQKVLFCKHEQNVQFSGRRYKISLGLDMDPCEEHICRNDRIFRACCIACLSFDDCVTEIFRNVTARSVRFTDVRDQVDRFLWFLWR